MKTLAYSAVIALLCLPTISAADTVEDKLLDKFVGTWKNTVTVHTAQWNPQEKKQTGDTICKRTLGGAFVQEWGKHSDGSTGMTMYSWDKDRRHYRSWWFGSEGMSSESVGVWDEKEQKMEWRANEAGYNTRAFQQFVSDDEIKWEVVVRNPAGDIVYKMTGNAKRVKEAAAP
jgi:hypothetical protein